MSYVQIIFLTDSQAWGYQRGCYNGQMELDDPLSTSRNHSKNLKIDELLDLRLIYAALEVEQEACVGQLTFNQTTLY